MRNLVLYCRYDLKEAMVLVGGTNQRRPTTGSAIILLDGTFGAILILLAYLTGRSSKSADSILHSAMR